jgi:hypothetical protein
MRDITPDDLVLAQQYGHRFDIGGISPDDKRLLTRGVTHGTVLKVRGCWPWLLVGTCWKTCYIATAPDVALSTAAQ